MIQELLFGSHIQQEPLVIIADLIGWLVGVVTITIVLIYGAFVVQFGQQRTRSFGKLLEEYNEAIRQCVLDLEQDDESASESDRALISTLIRDGTYSTLGENR